MNPNLKSGNRHDHFFLGDNHQRNERKVWLVIALTASMMIVEIVAGNSYGSMALVADGWHMSTHAGAMLITALAYGYARRNANNPKFTFGTGKLGDLAGFASAIVLALIALLIAWESLLRLANPIQISFNQAIAVALIGLLVNMVSAWLLKDDHSHHHHEHESGHDHNLKAAYIHVLADALTSVFAIVALLLGRSYGWLWADPVMGVVGALVIARWSWGLIQDAGGVLLDAAPEGEEVKEEIKQALAESGDEITDLHVWQVGPGHFAAIVSLASMAPKDSQIYKAMLSHIHALSHITLETHKLSA
jgi:cation diffusion facilitator family transporter